MPPVDSTTGLTGFGSVDGSTYDPFTNTLLFTQEQSSSTRTGAGRVIQVTPNWPPKVTTLEAFLGLGGYEGVHPDDNGNIYIIEDIGGARNATTQAAEPNSFILTPDSGASSSMTASASITGCSSARYRCRS